MLMYRERAFDSLSFHSEQNNNCKAAPRDTSPSSHPDDNRILERVRVQKARREQQIRQLQSQNHRLRDLLLVLQDERADSRNCYEATRKEYQIKKAEWQERERAQSRSTQRSMQLQLQVGRLSQQMDRILKSEAYLKEENQSLQDRLKKTEAKQSELQASVDMMRRRVMNEESQSRRMSVQYQQAVQRSEILSDKVSRLERQSETLRHQLEGETRQREHRLMVEEGLRRSLGEAEKQIKQLWAQLRENRNTEDKLKAELESAVQQAEFEARRADGLETSLASNKVAKELNVQLGQQMQFQLKKNACLEEQIRQLSREFQAYREASKEEARMLGEANGLLEDSLSVTRERLQREQASAALLEHEFKKLLQNKAKQCEQAASQLDMLSAENRGLNQRCLSIRTELQAVQTELFQLQRKSRQNEQELCSTVNTQRQRTISLESLLKQKSTSLCALQDQKSRTHRELDLASERINNQSKQLERLRRAVKEHQENGELQKNNAADAATHASKVELQLQSLEKQFIQLSKELNEAKSISADVEAEQQQAKLEIVRLGVQNQELVAALQSEKRVSAALKDQVARENSRCAELEHQLTAYRVRELILKEEEKQLSAKMVELQSRCKSLSQLLSRMEEEADTRSQLHGLQQQSLRSELQCIDRERQLLLREVGQLGRELEFKGEQHSTAQKQLGRTRQQYAAMQLQLASLSKECSQLKQEYEAVLGKLKASESTADKLRGELNQSNLKCQLLKEAKNRVQLRQAQLELGSKDYEVSLLQTRRELGQSRSAQESERLRRVRLEERVLELESRSQQLEGLLQQRLILEEELRMMRQQTADLRAEADYQKKRNSQLEQLYSRYRVRARS